MIVAISAALLPGAVAQAADCARADDQATLDTCAEHDRTQADAELNRLYKQVQDRLGSDGEQMKRLVATQRAWLAFRDAECKFVSQPGPEAGSIFPMVLANCLTSLTRKRSADFKSYLTCPEGDVSCPLPPG
jgi:uncharacterized protein YecT (DUF1311 family)